ncbi:MAG TPA: COX15/CtaA family protein [Candidatus Limnocylindria bacterium]|nr:COX15/CtaA family protein [Candidatus Limnocylindria bacterium]
MSTIRPFRIAASLGLASTLLLYGLIVIGSVVRTTGSGLACPDWPLCHGRLIPPLQFNVLIEWFHRLVALLVSVLLFVTAAWVFCHRVTRARLGGLAALTLMLLGAQILLGALTVWKLLDPAVVGGHLGVALLLFLATLTLTLVAQSEAEPLPTSTLPRPPGLLAAFGVVTALAYAQSLLGGLVSTHHAGLACPDWPTCFGEWFPPLQGLVGLQMLHRYGAYLLTGLLLFAAARARLAPDRAVRASGTLALGLTAVQVVMGVCNVFLGTPVWLSAAHLANAAAILAVLVTVTYRIAALPAAATRLMPAEAR